jgi:Beta-propeller repeat
MAASNPVAKARLSELYGKLPLSFEANVGQVDGAVKFLSRCQGHMLFLTATEAVLRLGPPHETNALHLQLLGGNSHPRVVGMDPQGTTSNYLVGNDPAKWHTGVKHYAKVRYEAVYPGVDLVYRGNQHQLEYDFVVAPGADPRVIRLAFTGADALAIGPQGELTLHTAHGDLVQPAPVVYQELAEGRMRIEGRYVFLRPPGHGRRGDLRRTVGFALGRYDRAQPLIIDPVLVYSIVESHTQQGSGIALDGAGNAYVTGTLQNGGNIQGIVEKINAAGSAIVYATILSGNGDVLANAIAVDGAGNAYVAGTTTSTNFPGVNGSSAQSANAGGFDAFVTKINPAGTAPVYSTFLGGSGRDSANAIALDGGGLAYVTGDTTSTNFPVSANALQPVFAGGSFDGDDAFLTVIKTDGTAFVYSTFLGGSGDDYGSGIAVDPRGNIYLTGSTTSSTFPGVTSTSLQPLYGGGEDAFVTMITADFHGIGYSTFLGGGEADFANAIAVDGASNAYITGGTASNDFPVTANAIQPVFAGGTGGGPLQNDDAFVTVIAPDGTALVYSTFLGGSGDDYGYGIAVDSTGNAYVTGSTTSTTFPGVSGSSIQPTNVDIGGFSDAFFTKIDAGGAPPIYSTFLGNGDTDRGLGIAVDGAGNAYLTGTTIAPGGNLLLEAFVTKIGPLSPCTNSDGTLCLVPLTNSQGDTASQGRFRVEVSSSTGALGHAVPLTQSSGYFWLDNPALAEILVRVQPCGTSGFALFAAGLSTLGTRIAVLDTETGKTATYPSSSGSLTAPVVDRVTFGCSGSRAPEARIEPELDSDVRAVNVREEAAPAASQRPAISFSPSGPSANEEVTFVGRPPVASGLTRIWSFSDDPPGVTHLELNGLIIHQFTAAGQFTVTFFDANQVGTGAPVSIDLTVSAATPGVQVSVTGPASTSVNSTVSFQAAATNCQPGSQPWTWLVDGAVVVGGNTGPSIQLSWPTAGRKRLTASNLGCGTASGAKVVRVLQPPSGAASCRPSPTLLCLDNSRFQVSATWTKPDGSHGPAEAVGLSGVEGYLSLGSGGPDVLVRVSSSCASAHAYAVLAGGFSTIRVGLTVKDEKTGKSKTYATRQGALFTSVNDESSFRTCP